MHKRARGQLISEEKVQLKRECFLGESNLLPQGEKVQQCVVGPVPVRGSDKAGFVGCKFRSRSLIIYYLSRSSVPESDRFICEADARTERNAQI